MTTGAISVILALHHAVKHRDKSSVETLLDGLTPDQQLQLLFTRDSYGDTALHVAARNGYTETVKALLEILTPEQQLKILSVENRYGNNASQETARNYRTTDTITALVQYQIEADYRVNFGKFASLTNNF